jgi:D-glycero-D-manno-heptose 1,7-bisphosphate phosphatase
MEKLRQAVILAGGQGTRLRPLTLTTPKPLIPIHGKPFAAYLVTLLKNNGIEEIIFLTGYLGEQFPSYFGDGSAFGVSIKYSHSAIEDDTAERIRKAKDLLDEHFLLLYGDNYWPLNLEKLLAFHKERNTLATVTVYERQDPEKKNNMRVSLNGFVEVYDKKRETPGLNGVDIGFFILSREVLNFLPQENKNFESSVLPQLIDKKQLAGFLTKQPYWGLTDIERLPSVERALNPKRRVLFLDRDGTLNVRPPQAEYIQNKKEFIFLPGAVEALQQLAANGYEMYLISNQPGIARGVMTEQNLQDIHTYLQEELQKKGVTLSGIYYCPHGWDDGCECRKPKPGMLFRAAREHNIDLSRSIFVGDDERDKEAGDAAGVPTILVSSEVGIAMALDKLL